MTFFAPALAKALPTAPSTRTVLVDRVHYYKDAMLGRFYAICNCCSCCLSRAESRGAQPRGGGAMQAHQHGTPMLASSGYVARVDADLCAACGTCADVCQFAVISVDDGFAHIDAADCMGCGVCVAHCPQEAISLVRDPAKGEPLEIQELVAHAAQLT
jgi:Pyruvate/2-oxoacid:ferredoxin oxidoreductase delta subunit